MRTLVLVFLSHSTSSLWFHTSSVFTWIEVKTTIPSNDCFAMETGKREREGEITNRSHEWKRHEFQFWFHNYDHCHRHCLYHSPTLASYDLICTYVFDKWGHRCLSMSNQRRLKPFVEIKDIVRRVVCVLFFVCLCSLSFFVIHVFSVHVYHSVCKSSK